MDVSEPRMAAKVLPRSTPRVVGHSRRPASPKASASGGCCVRLAAKENRMRKTSLTVIVLLLLVRPQVHAQGLQIDRRLTFEARPVGARVVPEGVTLATSVGRLRRADGTLATAALQQQGQPQGSARSWAYRHPVAVGFLIGAGAGAAQCGPDSGCDYGRTAGAGARRCAPWPAWSTCWLGRFARSALSPCTGHRIPRDRSALRRHARGSVAGGSCGGLLEWADNTQASLSARLSPETRCPTSRWSRRR